MRKVALCTVLALASCVVVIGSAAAEVTRLRISFAGGCVSTNTDGGCTIKTLASGSDLDTEFLALYVSDGPNSSFRKASRHYSFVDASGVGRSRLRNRPGGCFQMRTAPNGNENPDVNSNVLCEK